jgi:hypothetical protein
MTTSHCCVVFALVLVELQLQFYIQSVTVDCGVFSLNLL